MLDPADLRYDIYRGAVGTTIWVTDLRSGISVAGCTTDFAIQHFHGIDKLTYDENLLRVELLKKLEARLA